MTYKITVQRASKSKSAIPSHSQFKQWITATLKDLRSDGEVLVRLVDEQESAELNEQYRKRSGPTNILSFPIFSDIELPVPLLGDLIICVPLVLTEAEQQAKPTESHWAHLTVHGSLHLLGYDHHTESEAAVMEDLETTILAKLGYPNPYGDDNLHE